jgi:hypothetical protein
VDLFEAQCVTELVADHPDLAADWSVSTPIDMPTPLPRRYR